MATRGRPRLRTAHTQKRHPLWWIYKAMRNRCERVTCKCYPSYGGRGITVCDRWKGPNGFYNFVDDVGPRPTPQHTLDRYPDNDGPYHPSNVRWATPKEQGANTRKNLIKGTSVRALAQTHGINPRTAYDRYHAGVPINQKRKHGMQPLTDYTIDGITSSLYTHAQRIGLVTPFCAYDRVRRGWSPEAAVKTPKKK